MRQVAPGEVDSWRSSYRNNGRGRIAVPREGPRIPSPRRTAQDSRKGNRTHLPRSDDATRSAVHDRGSLRRNNPRSRGRFEGGSNRSGGEGSRVDGYSGKPSQALSP